MGIKEICGTDNHQFIKTSFFSVQWLELAALIHLLWSTLLWLIHNIVNIVLDAACVVGLIIAVGHDLILFLHSFILQFLQELQQVPNIHMYPLFITHPVHI
jgi:ABC-type nitrate/sulfonate/bicarbonate transport system permease component